MSKRKIESSEDPYEVLMGKAVHQMPAFRQTLCSDRISDEQYAARKISEISSVLWLTDTMSEDEKNLRIARAIELYESLAPQDGMEAMLALQMVATHFAALEAMSQAGVPGRFIGGVEKFMNTSAKLMSLYTRQMEALEAQKRRRAKSQQPLAVQEVETAQETRTLTDSAGPSTVTPITPQKPRRPRAAKAGGPALSLVATAADLPKARAAGRSKAKRA